MKFYRYVLSPFDLEYAWRLETVEAYLGIGGIIDTRQLFFYFTGTTLTLILTILGVEARLLHN